MPRLKSACLFATLLAGASPAATQTLAQLSADDDFSWLNRTHDPKAVDWAAMQTEKAMARLTASPAFAQVEREMQAAEIASRPTPGYFLLGRTIVRFARDHAHPHGVFAAAPLDAAGHPGAWRDALDVDALDRKEGKDLDVMFLDLGKTCLAPDYTRCMIPFGAGGSSLIEYREFDFATERFVAGGFDTTPSRGGVAWLDKDHLLIAHASDPAGLLPSGFPRNVYVWKRGTTLADAKPLMAAAATDAVLDVYPFGNAMPGKALIVLARDYATFELYLASGDGGVSRIDLPTALQGFGEPHIVGSSIVVQLARGAVLEGRAYPADTLIAYDPATPAGARISEVYRPGDGRYVNDPFSGIVSTRSGVAFVVTAHLGKSLLFASRRGREWTTRTLTTAPPGVAMKLGGADPNAGAMLVEQSGFLKPTEVSIETPTASRETLFTAQPIIDASRFVSEIRSARSADGTAIDYYLIRPKAPKPGHVPTILYGYGGYGVNADPSYFEGGLGPTLASWLNRGGAYAVAAIRGGSERGSAWALAAKGTNRQRSFDDFAAVAQAMIASGFTDRDHLGSMGRSFGGLLSANMVTQHPDLFGAALVGVPIVDLFRLGVDGNDISAGQKIEVGDWNDPTQVPLMLRYSPYQNIRAGVRYPHVLAVASTQDGQVGPGHARRFVAKLQSFGADALLIEAPTGGHAFPSEFANPREYAAQVTFFIDTLMK